MKLPLPVQMSSRADVALPSKCLPDWRHPGGATSRAGLYIFSFIQHNTAGIIYLKNLNSK